MTFDDDRDDSENERWECIGPDCINPHFIHMRSECFTVEDCEDQC